MFSKLLPSRSHWNADLCSNTVSFPLAGYAMTHLAEPFKKNQFEGCIAMMYAGTVTKESGQYICVPAIVEEGTKMSQSDELADSLMELTRKVVAEKTKKDSVDKGCPFDDVVLH